MALPYKRGFTGLLFFLFSAFHVLATTNNWYPNSTPFSGWPTNWVSIPSLNDPKELSAANARVDFVGDTSNPGAYWSSNSNYFFIRVRVAVSNVISTTFHDSHWIYIDRIGYSNGAAAPNMPDYALVWDSKSNDSTAHGLELSTGTNLSATTYWSQLALSDIDGNSNQKISPPDIGLTGDGYLRTIDMQPTTNFGYTTFIDFAVKWSFIAANTALNTNQHWRLQFGSRNDANDHNFPQDDIAGGFSPSSVVTSSYSAVIASVPLSSSVDIGLYATSTGVTAEVWTIDESGSGDIVVLALLDGVWVEVGRVASTGTGSNRYEIPVTGLVVGQSYVLKVLDESGHEHYLSAPATVRTIRMALLHMDLLQAELSFETEPGRLYEVLVSTDLVHWTREIVSYPMADGSWSQPDQTTFTAPPGDETRVRVPRYGRSQAYFKVRRVYE